MKTKPTDQLPPHSIEAEQGVLGCCLLNQEKLDVCLQFGMTRQWFYDLRHSAIFDALVATYNRAAPGDSIIIAQALKESGKLEAAGGLAYLSELPDKVPSAEIVTHYAQILRDYFIRRRLMFALADGQLKVRDERETADNLMASVESAIDQCRIGVAEAESMTSKEAVATVIDTLQERAEKAKESSGVTGVPTGFKQLNRMTAGWQAGELILVCARPAVGKSALLMNFARAAAVDSRVPTLVLTAEMSIEQMARRLVCEVASVDGKIVRNGDIYNIPSYAAEQRRLVTAAARVQKSPIFWKYVKGMAACEVGALIRSHVRKHGVGLVVIDYLQLLEPDHRTGTMTYDIGTVAESLKGFGVKNNVPIICAAQLNRECAKGNRRPQISDIGDSKQIEQAGEVIMLIHRDTEEDPTKAEVNLAKQREGETGVIPMGYVPAWCRFTEEAVVPA